MGRAVREYILAVLLFTAINAQWAPHWGSISCDTSLTGWFPAGSRYTNYDRYYTFTAAYQTLIRRDVRISTCIENLSNSIAARFYNSTRLRDTRNPTSTIGDDYAVICDVGEIGYAYYFRDLPEGDWEIGIYNTDSLGGKYKLSVECIEPPTPTPNQLKNTNVTIPFPFISDYIAQGSKKISCGVSAFSSIVNGETGDWYEFSIIQYAQELMFTTCTPETAVNGIDTTYPGSTLGNHSLQFYYWDFDNRQWSTLQVYTGGCETIAIGDAYDIGYTNILRLSPDRYYISAERLSTPVGDVDYVLSMMCWNNNAIHHAVAGFDYIPATFYPTSSPITVNPTTLQPASNNPQTLSPTTYPTVTFDGVYNRVNNTMNIGQISCGIHQHDVLKKAHSNYYMFQVLSGTDVYFDTCMNDSTRFDAQVRLYYYGGDDEFYYYDQSTSYCNILSDVLPPNIYYIEIFGQNKTEDFGEYVLRMGCGYMQQDQVTPVDPTNLPSISPTHYQITDTMNNIPTAAPTEDTDDVNGHEIIYVLMIVMVVGMYM